jgi:NADH-quinone oxidoreductase subunit A
MKSRNGQEKAGKDEGRARDIPNKPKQLAKYACPSKFRQLEHSEQLTQYLPVLMLGAVAVVFSFGMLVGSVILGKKGKRSQIKDTAYECGMIPVGEGSVRFSVRFYLVAMLFILFDIEVVFLYPWAAVYRDLLKSSPAAVLGGMLSFIGILFVGYLYALKKGAFDWKS